MYHSFRKILKIEKSPQKPKKRFISVFNIVFHYMFFDYDSNVFQAPINIEKVKKSRLVSTKKIFFCYLVFIFFLRCPAILAFFLNPILLVAVPITPTKKTRCFKHRTSEILNFKILIQGCHSSVWFTSVMVVIFI